MKNLVLKIPNPQGVPVEIKGPTEFPTGGLYDKGTDIIQVGLTLLFLFGIVLAIVFIIYSGLQWAMSGGDKQKLQNARNRLIYSIIGLLVVSLSFIILINIIELTGGYKPLFFLKIPLK